DDGQRCARCVRRRGVHRARGLRVRRAVHPLHEALEPRVDVPDDRADPDAGGGRAEPRGRVPCRPRTATLAHGLHQPGHRGRSAGPPPPPCAPPATAAPAARLSAAGLASAAAAARLAPAATAARLAPAATAAGLAPAAAAAGLAPTAGATGLAP